MQLCFYYLETETLQQPHTRGSFPFLTPEAGQQGLQSRSAGSRRAEADTRPEPLPPGKEKAGTAQGAVGRGVGGILISHSIYSIRTK